MRWIFLIGCWLWVWGANAQTDYFIKAFDVGNGSDIPWTVIVENDGYIIYDGGRTSAFGGTSAIKLIKTDLEGNIIWTKIHGETSFSYFGGKSGSMVKASDSTYVLGGTFQKNPDGSMSDAHLLLFNSNGDTLWRKTYPRVNFDAIHQTRNAPDGGFIMLGETASLGDYDGDFFLIKTDSAGNFEWQKRYGGTLRDRGLSIEVTQDNGYILSGTNLSFGPGGGGAYVVKTDYNGNIQWDSTYGTQGLDYAGQVTTSYDGGYLLWGGLDTTINFNDNDQTQFVYKLNRYGDVVWRSFFNSPNKSEIWQLRELSNGDIVFIGDKYDPQINNEAAWIVRLNKNGSKLWERTYTYEEDTIDHQRTIELRGDFQPTPDKGFIVIGVVWSRIGTSNVFAQDALMMKLDSMGCLVPGCDTITNIQDVPDLPAEISILPNPFSHSARVAIRLPMYEAKPLQFHLYNLSGQRVQSHSITVNGSGYTEFTLQRQQLPAGIYFYELVNEGALLGRGKVVMQ